MTPLARTARYAGLLYLVMAALMVFGYMFVPARFIVAGDAAGTAQRILAGETLYRVSIVTALIAQLLFVFVALALFDLFKDVDRGLARVMATLVCVGVAAELVSVAGRMAPLILLDRDASYLAVFNRPQLEALAYGFLRLSGQLARLITAIWGLWLVPFGLLTIRSRFVPWILGVLLIAAGVGYMTTCLVYVVAPERLALVSRFMSPLYFGEVPIILWLLVMGAKAPAAAPVVAPARA